MYLGRVRAKVTTASPIVFTERRTGTAGIKILTSRDAKKVYAFTTAAALRAKEAVMTTATNIREGADDILADAKALNEKYAAEDAPETIEDAAE